MFYVLLSFLYFMETHFERFYSQNQIKEILNNAGFRQIKILNNLTNNIKIRIIGLDKVKLFAKYYKNNVNSPVYEKCI